MGAKTEERRPVKLSPIIQATDDRNLDQDGSNGGREKGLDSGNILKLTGFAGKLDMEIRKKVKYDSKVSDLSN